MTMTKVAMLIASTTFSTRRCAASSAWESASPPQQSSAIPRTLFAQHRKNKGDQDSRRETRDGHSINDRVHATQPHAIASGRGLDRAGQPARAPDQDAAD